ncbi:MAG: dTDP-4-dehydrorhamnose 3,5-epimerase [Ginsengibacter sp.]
MIFNETSLQGIYVIELEPIADERGWFSRVFCKDEFSNIGHEKEWLQLNHSFTKQAGTIRGMHFQRPPFAEIKLVRCIAGAVYDVVVDIRERSPTFLNYFGVEISAGNKKMIYIPEGFAHGFQSLANNSELIYHHTAMYTPGAEEGLRYDDQMLNIHWPISVTALSDRDKMHNYLDKDFKGV